MPTVADGGRRPDELVPAGPAVNLPVFFPVRPRSVLVLPVLPRAVRVLLCCNLKNRTPLSVLEYGGPALWPG